MSKLLSVVPDELREFAGTFDQLAYRHSDYGSVFSDFVSFWTGGMLLNGDKPLAEELENRYGEDYKFFNQLVVSMLKAYDKMLVDESCWYDGLGLFYECIRSQYKGSVLGQFFTPAPVIDLLSILTNPSKSERVLDPCSGSGRFLLAAQIADPSSKKYATDVDPVCAKMSAINMAMHGCTGEVSCMNALTLEWRFGYVLNPFFKFGSPPIPHLELLESFEFSAFYYKKEQLKEAAEAVEEQGQLSLF